MTQKRTDLAKKLGEKINGRMKKASSPDRFGKASGQGSQDGTRLNPLIAGLLKKAPAPEK